MTVPDLEDALGYNIYRAGLLFRRELIRALSEYKMTPEQWQGMMTLWQTGKPVSQGEIVRMLMKDKPTVSRIIQRLSRDGWIKKQADAGDARVAMIRLTRKGVALKDEIPPKLSAHFDQILGHFDDREMERAIAFLKRLRGVLGD
jgi:DNA-binding MarR family transcriptional regulator